MGRHARSRSSDTWHHVFNRGARHLPIFGSDDDRRVFLHLLDRAAADGAVHAYALMGNHYHLLIESPTVDLSATMKLISENYTRYFNTTYGYDGPLFRSRFGSKPIRSEVYRREVIRYIHANPVTDQIGDWTYRWSGHRAYLGLAAVPRWLSVSCLHTFGGRSGYRDFVEAGSDLETSIARPSTRTRSPRAVERAFGVASKAELAVIVKGGRGVRNDLRLAVALLAVDATSWSRSRLALRYGYSSSAALRTAVGRARRRVESDPDFAHLVRAARDRLQRFAVGDGDVAGV
ncbi:MAG: transposase [Actinomycetota bacterium]